MLDFEIDKLSMGLVKEPLHVDFNIQSIPWRKEEEIEFNEFIKVLKAKYKRKKEKKATAVLEPA